MLKEKISSYQKRI